MAMMEKDSGTSQPQHVQKQTYVTVSSYTCLLHGWFLLGARNVVVVLLADSDGAVIVTLHASLRLAS